MVDGGVGISAVVGIGSKFIERSTFTARHDASCDKEADKTLKLAERFDRIPQEDVDHFEFQEYNMLHSRSMGDLRHYRSVQEEYKRKEWFKEPLEKFRTRGKARHAKRSLQSSTAQEERHLHDLETYSRASSSCGSQVNSCANSDSGLDLGRHSRPYRTDSCSIRALGGSPPSASLEDICSDEKKAQVVTDVSAWLSSTDVDIHSNEGPDAASPAAVIDPDLTNAAMESDDSVGGGGATGNNKRTRVAVPCANCGSSTTPLWRDDMGDLCHACDRYFIPIYRAAFIECLKRISGACAGGGNISSSHMSDQAAAEALVAVRRLGFSPGEAGNDENDGEEI